jgi:hypothetical protein
MSWWDAVLPSLVLGGCDTSGRKPLLFPLYYTPPEATDLDHILTISRPMVTGRASIGSHERGIGR